MNFNYKIVGLLLLGLLLVLGVGLAESTITPDRLRDEGAQTGTGLVPVPPLNVILISWDGAQRAHLSELRDQGLLPNLAALAEEGAAIPMEVTGHATDTKAGHAQMLTGYGPDITGVYSNRRYRAIPEGLTIFERLKARFGRNITTIAITGKRGNISEILENALPELDLALIRNANAALNGPRMLQALEALQDRPFFAFFHFSDPDHAGHAHGENSQEYSEAIQICDRWLGEIVARLKELRVYERTLIYVTTDHGFDEGQRSHFNAPEIWLATNDPQVDRREDLTVNQGDIAPTILERFGLDLDSIEPPLSGRSLISGATPPTSVWVQRDAVFATVEGLPLKLDAYRPRLPGPLPAIIFVHGGGWVGGDKRGMEPYARYFAERGYVGFAVNYRLAPDFKFPAQIEDAKCAVRWVRQHAAEYNVDPDRIGALGTSAGGHLVGLLGVTDGSEGLEGACGDPAISSRVQAVAPYFGPMDLAELFSGTAHGAQTAMKLFGTTCEADLEMCRRASPIAHVSPDDPPFMLVHGTLDPVVPFEQSVSMEHALQTAGVEAELVPIERAGHGWPLDSSFGRQALAQVVPFFERHLKGSVASNPQTGDGRAYDMGGEAAVTASADTEGPLYVTIMTHVEGDRAAPEGSPCTDGLHYQTAPLPPPGQPPRGNPFAIDIAGTELLHEILQRYRDSAGQAGRLFIEPAGEFWQTEADPTYGGKLFRRYDWLTLGDEFGIQGHGIYYSGQSFCWHQSLRTEEGIQRKLEDLQRFAEQVVHNGQKINAGLTLTPGAKIEGPTIGRARAEWVYDHVAYELGYRISFEDHDGHLEDEPPGINDSKASYYLYEAVYDDGVRMLKVDFNGSVRADCPGHTPRCETPEEAIARLDRTLAAQAQDPDPSHVYYFAFTVHSNGVWTDFHMREAGLPLRGEGAGLTQLLDAIQGRVNAGVRIQFVTPRKLKEIFERKRESPSSVNEQ